MNVRWNSNGRDVLLAHERSHIESLETHELPVPAYVSGLGGTVDVDDHGCLWLSVCGQPNHGRLLGDIGPPHESDYESIQVSNGARVVTPAAPPAPPEIDYAKLAAAIVEHQRLASAN